MAEPKRSTNHNEPSSQAHSIIEYGKVIAVTFVAALFLKWFVVDAYRIPSRSMEKTLLVGDYILVNELAYGIHMPRWSRFHIPSPFGHGLQRGDIIVFEYPGNPDEIFPSKHENYVKRCIGLPGDSIVLQHGNLFVNGNAISMPGTGLPASRMQIPSMQATENIFPRGSGFTEVEYGPLRVPRCGDTIALNSTGIENWKIFIEREGHRVGNVNDSLVTIDNKPQHNYRVERNYFFTLGDNRDNSLDSRFWGFVPEENILGEAVMIYWSWDQDAHVSTISEKFATIRWNRVGMVIR
jgi:signal peptidase I